MQVPVSQPAGIVGKTGQMTEETSPLNRVTPPENAWLQTPLGQSLLAQEMRLVETALEGLFGEQCLQLGLWGGTTTFTRFARTQRATTLADPDHVGPADDPAAWCQLHRLPVASQSIDVVLLPHTLDYSDDRSHAILREADRVLTPHGHLLVLGFKPGGLWGLRRLVPGAAMPPGAGRLISEGKLTDWLQLLAMHVHGQTRYFFRWPLPGNKRPSSPAWESRGRRFWPELAACYMLVAQKRVGTLTPVKQPWRTRPKVVGGIVEPSTRASRIRFDRHR